MGFPTGLARLHHARRVVGSRKFHVYKGTVPSSDQQLFLSFFSPFFTKISWFSPFSNILCLWLLQVVVSTPWWCSAFMISMPSGCGIFGKFSSLMRLCVDRGLLEALTSFWDSTHCCFSIGEMDLVPTLEEYVELLQLGSPFGDTPFVPSSNPWSNRALEKCLGLTFEVLR